MIYELRTYIIPEGRMQDILDRFEQITFGLFDRHKIEVVGFWTRADVNHLVYICKFETEAAKDAAWDAFREDPDWAKAKEKTEANGPIVEKVISDVLIPTSFSPIK